MTTNGPAAAKCACRNSHRSWCSLVPIGRGRLCAAASPHPWACTSMGAWKWGVVEVCASPGTYAASRTRSAWQTGRSSSAPVGTRQLSATKWVCSDRKYDTHAVWRSYLHCVENALGLADWAKLHGATLIATDDKDRTNSGADPCMRVRCAALHRIALHNTLQCNANDRPFVAQLLLLTPGALQPMRSQNTRSEHILRRQGCSVKMCRRRLYLAAEFDKQLPDADVIITTPYYPVYLTRECPKAAWGICMDECCTLPVHRSNRLDCMLLDRQARDPRAVTTQHLQRP